MFRVFLWFIFFCHYNIYSLSDHSPFSIDVDNSSLVSHLDSTEMLLSKLLLTKIFLFIFPNIARLIAVVETAGSLHRHTCLISDNPHAPNGKKPCYRGGEEGDCLLPRALVKPPPGAVSTQRRPRLNRGGPKSVEYSPAEGPKK